MYRVMKKITRRTDEYKCLACKYAQDLKLYNVCKVNNEKGKEVETFDDAVISCGAPNACVKGRFSAKYFFCTEYKGFSELKPEELQNIVDKQQKIYSDEALKEYAKKYICKKDRKEFIETKQAEIRNTEALIKRMRDKG
jgi:hypothetical protein